MKDKYRIVEYNKRYYVEKEKSQGIWDILRILKTEEEANEYLKKLKNNV